MFYFGGELLVITVRATRRTALAHDIILKIEMIFQIRFVKRNINPVWSVGSVIRIEMSYCPTCIRRSVLPSLYKMMHGTLV